MSQMFEVQLKVYCKAQARMIRNYQPLYNDIVLESDEPNPSNDINDPDLFDLMIDVFKDEPYCLFFESSFTQTQVEVLQREIDKGIFDIQFVHKGQTILWRPALTATPEKDYSAMIDAAKLAHQQAQQLSE